MALPSCTGPGPMRRKRLPHSLHLTALWLGLWSTTFFDGATTQLAAFILRVGAACLAVVVWPHCGVFLRAGAVKLGLVLLATAVWGVVAAAIQGEGCAAGGSALQSLGTCLMATLLILAPAHGARQVLPQAVQQATTVGSIHAVWAISQKLHIVSGHAHRSTAGFFSPNDFAAFLVPLIFWAWWQARCATNTATRRRNQATTATLATGLWCSGSRSGILAALCGSGLLFMTGVPWRGGRDARSDTDPRRDREDAIASRNFASALYMATAVVAAAWALRYRFSVHYDTYAFARWHIWRASLQAFWHNPAGIGWGRFATYMRQHGVMMPGPVHFPNTANGAHSELLQTAVELGVLGLAALFLLCLAIVKLVRRQAAAERTVHIAIAQGFLAPALCDTTLHQPGVAALFALWLAHLWQQSKTEPPAAANTQRHMHSHSRPQALAQAQTQTMASTEPNGTEPSATLAQTDHMYAPDQPAVSLWPTATVLHRAGAGLLAATCALILTPALLSHLALQRGTRLRQQAQGQASVADAARIARWAGWARATAPWSVGTALAAESLLIAGPPLKAPLAQVGTWLSLSDDFEQAAEPLRRAAQTLQGLAHGPTQWTQVAVVWQAAAAREPHNALLWLHAAQAADRGFLPAQAAPLFARALAEEPLCAGAWLGVAERAWAQKDLAPAQTALHAVHRALQLAPQAEGFARAVLTLDASERISLATLAAEVNAPLQPLPQNSTL